MHLLLGNSRMESGNYEDAIRSFEYAQAQLRPHTSQALLIVSLVSFLTAILQRIEIDRYRGQISGWKFDELDIALRQRLCEALYAAGRTNEAGKSLLDIVNNVDEEVYMRGPITTWVSGESCSTCSSAMRLKFHRRFIATMSLHSRKQWRSNLEGSAVASCNPPFTIPHAALERMGKIKIDRGHVERCPGCRCQCRYSFTLVALVGLTLRWYGVYVLKIHNLSNYL